MMDAAAFVQKQAEKRNADQKALFERCIQQEVEYLDHAYAARGKPSHPVRLFR